MSTSGQLEHDQQWLRRMRNGDRAASDELGDADSTGAGVREAGQVEDPWRKQVDVE